MSSQDGNVVGNEAVKIREAPPLAAPILRKERFSGFREYLQNVGFKFEERPHQVYLARSGKLVVNLYENGKVVITGSIIRAPWPLPPAYWPSLPFFGP